MFPTIYIGSFPLSTHVIANALAGLIVGLGAWLRVRTFLRQSVHDIIDACFLLVPGVLVGAWIASVLPDLADFLLGRVVAERWWLGGTNWLGALTGGLVMGYLYCRQHHLPFGKMIDAFAPLLGFALAMVRVGCLLAGDSQGLETTSWLAVYLPDSSGNWAYRYPTQPVSIAVNVLLSMALFAFEGWVKRSERPQGWPFEGFMFMLYVELFCLQRLYFESWRADAVPLFGAFTWMHLYCVIALILATWGIVRGLRRVMSP